MSNEYKDALAEEMWDFMDTLASAEDVFFEDKGDVLSAVDLELFNEWRNLCNAFQSFSEKAEAARHKLADNVYGEWEE
jgi:hypothetical protein